MAEVVEINKSGIYVILNKTNGLFYIGMAISFRKRWELHKYELRKNKHHSKHLQNAWNKYGEENFEFFILEIVEDRTKLLEYEQFWLDLTKCYNFLIGYNICKVADSRLGLKSSPEHIAKIIAGNKGKKRSKEIKEKLRKLRLGSKLTEEQKQARRNFRHSEETKLKIASRKGWKHSIEAKEKMSKRAKNRIKRPLSIETKLKLSFAAKEQWKKFKLQSEGIH